MKLALGLLLSVGLTLPAYALSVEKQPEQEKEKSGPVIKEVCKDKKDNAGKVVKDKDGKVVQTCKKIKVHKKLEGTKVPDQKK